MCRHAAPRDTRDARVLSAGIEPTSIPSEGTILSIERREVSQHYKFKSTQYKDAERICYTVAMEIKTSTLVIVAIILAVIAALLLQVSDAAKNRRVTVITNFEQCAQAGYPILESYPEQCRTPDGRTFVKHVPTNMIPPPTEMPESARDQQPGGDDRSQQDNGCAVAGCSAQLCVSAAEAADIVTTCEYRAEYACYKEAACEPQADGKCGWTLSADAVVCLETAGNE